MPRIYYGWWIVVTLGLSAVSTYGIGVYAFTLFLHPLELEFGLRRAVSGGVVSAFWLAAPILLAVGSWITRYGARRLMLIGTLVESLALLLISRSQGIWALYLLRAAMGAGVLLVAASMPVVVCDWFERRRSLAMSIVFAGFQLGGLLVAPLTQRLLDTLGWRATAVVLAAVLPVATIPLVWGVMRYRKPADLGLQPDGDAGEPAAGQQLARGMAAEGSGWPLRAAITSPMFWALLAMTVLFYYTQSGLLLHQTAYVIELGTQPRLAADIFGLTAGMYIVGAIGAGLWLDRVFSRAALRWLFAIQILAVATLLALGVRFLLAALAVYVVLFGLTNGAGDVMFVIALRHWYGQRDYARIYGIWYLICNLTFALAPVLAGHLHDVTRRYTVAFEVAAGCAIVALGLAALTPVPPAQAPVRAAVR